eukprot:2185755-Pleurochrysis_carterae.AAC.3
MEGYVGYPPRPNQTHVIGSYAITWCRLPRMMETIIYMGLRATLWHSTASSYLCNSVYNSFMYIGIL